MANPLPHLCLTRYREFAPPWISQLVEQGWAEVEHRAWGFPLPKRGKLAPTRESDFMDPGAAGMWYVYRRGSGIFYRMGRTKTAPGKNDMLASLLQEAHANSSHRFALDAPWRSLVTKAGLFAPEMPTSGLLGDAGRILAAVNGSFTCGELGLRACRCTIVRTRLSTQLLTSTLKRKMTSRRFWATSGMMRSSGWQGHFVTRLCCSTPR